jgi:hypothetical protein
LNNLAKIDEIRKNLAETHRRRLRNSKNREHRNAASFTDKSAGLTDKSAVFPKIGVAISEQFFSEAGRFLLKIGKWNEKTVKNNDMTSTKFVYTNNP